MGRRRPRDLRPGQSQRPSPDQAATRRPTGPGTAAAGHLPALLGRLISGSGQAMPTHRAPYQRALRLRGRTGDATGQQRRRTQPAPPGRQSQDQRRHPVGTGQQQQDDPGFPLRHLARPRTESPRRLPTTAHFPATLNSYLGYVKLPPAPGVVTMAQLRMPGCAPRLPDDFRPGAQPPVPIPGNGE